LREAALDWEDACRALAGLTRAPACLQENAKALEAFRVHPINDHQEALNQKRPAKPVQETHLQSQSVPALSDTQFDVLKHLAGGKVLDGRRLARLSDVIAYSTFRKLAPKWQENDLLQKCRGGYRLSDLAERLVRKRLAADGSAR